MRALITTTGDRFARLRERSVIGGSLLFAAASSVSSPGTFVSIMEPGLKPSARFMSVGLIGFPSLFFGIEASFRWSRRPVSEERSRFVNRSFGHGYRHTAGSVKSQRLDGREP